MSPNKSGILLQVPLLTVTLGNREISAPVSFYFYPFLVLKLGRTGGRQEGKTTDLGDLITRE